MKSLVHLHTLVVLFGGSVVEGFFPTLSTNGERSTLSSTNYHRSGQRRYISLSPPISSESSLPDNQDRPDEDNSQHQHSFYLHRALRRLASQRKSHNHHDHETDEAEFDTTPAVSADDQHVSAASLVADAAACQEEWERYRTCPEDPADTTSLNIVLKAWGRCSQFLTEHRDDRQSPVTAPGGAPARFETAIYTAQDAAQRATDLLHRQEAELGAGAAGAQPRGRPNLASYNICMEAWARCRRPESAEQVENLWQEMRQAEWEPDMMSYKCLMDAYAHSDRDDRIDRISKRYKEMRQNSDLHLPVWLANSIINAYNRAGRSRSNLSTGWTSENIAKECLAILQRAKDHFAETQDLADRPDIVTYTNVLETLSRCESMDMVRVAEELFAEIKSLPHLSPTMYTYLNLMSAWARSKQTEAHKRVDALLQEAISIGVANTRLFTTTMQSWTRSLDPKKAVRCLELLKQMKQMQTNLNANVAPDASAYQISIEACGRTTGDGAHQNAALRIATAIFKSMQLDKSVQISSGVYVTLLNSVNSLLPPGSERSKVAQAVFEKAVADDKVDPRVVRSFQQAADADTVQESMKLTEGESGSKPPHLGYTGKQRPE